MSDRSQAGPTQPSVAAPTVGADAARTRGPFCMAAAAGFVLYALTAAPGVVWQDGATFQIRVWRGDLHGQLGLALGHPLYIALARAFSEVWPAGDIAYRVNMFSAFCAAVALGLATDLVIRLTSSRAAAAVGVLSLAVSHTFWKHAVLAEVYTLYAAILLAELCLLARFVSKGRSRYLLAAAFFNGLSISNHLLALLHVPAYAGFVVWAIRRRRLRAGQLPGLVFAYLGGVLPYAALIIREWMTGRPLGEALAAALFGTHYRQDVLNLSFSLARQTGLAVAYFGLNFPTPLAVFVPLGWWLCWSRPATRWFAAVAGGIFGLSFLFAFRYRVPDQYVFFFACYVLVPVFLSFAVAGVARRGAVWTAACIVGAALPAAVYEIVPPILARRNVSMPFRRDVPFREAYSYFLRPRMNGDDGPERFARAALAQAAPNGLLIADSTIAGPLIYVRAVHGVQRGVALSRQAEPPVDPPVVPLTPEAVEPFALRGAAYLCSPARGYYPEWLFENCALEEAGPVWRLVKPARAAKP